MLEQTRTPAFIDGLYGKSVEGGTRYFFPLAKLQPFEAGLNPIKRSVVEASDRTSLV
jgi:hypothetical protein